MKTTRKVLSVILALTMLLSVLVISPISVSAETVVYNVTDDCSGNGTGSVSFDKETAEEGDTVVITVDPDDDSMLWEMSISGTPDGESEAEEVSYKDGDDENTYEFKMPEYDVTVAVVFKKIPTITLGDADTSVEHIEGGQVAFVLTGDYMVDGEDVFEPDQPGNEPVVKWYNEDSVEDDKYEEDFVDGIEFEFFPQGTSDYVAIAYVDERIDAGTYEFVVEYDLDYRVIRSNEQSVVVTKSDIADDDEYETELEVLVGKTAIEDKEIGLPEIPKGASYGRPMAEAGSFLGLAKLDKANGTLTFNADTTNAEADDSADYTINVIGADNYDDYTLTVTVKVVDADSSTVIKIDENEKTYDGKEFVPEVIVTDAVGNEIDADYDVSWSKTGSSSKAPVDAGKYTMTVTLADGSKTESFTVTIKKKALEVYPASITIEENDSVTLKLEYDGLVKGDDVKFSKTPTFGVYKNSSRTADTTLSAARKSEGKYYLAWENASNSFEGDDVDNYDISIEAEEGTLTVKEESYYDDDDDDDDDDDEDDVTIKIEGKGSTQSFVGALSNGDKTATLYSVSSSKFNKLGVEGTVTVNLTTTALKKVENLRLPKSFIEDLVDEGTEELVIEYKYATMTIDEDALIAIEDTLTSSAMFTVELDPTLTSAQKKAINKLDDEVVIMAEILNGTKVIKDIDDGTVSIKVSGSWTTSQKDDVVAALVTSNGTLEEVEVKAAAKQATITLDELGSEEIYVIYVDEDAADKKEEDKETSKDDNSSEEDPVITWTNKFIDVLPTSWYFDAVRYVNAYSYMKGVTDTKFGPDTVLTRAMYVTVLYRIEGEPEVTGKTAFTDYDPADPDVYYADAVLWATQNGIISGMTETKFGPKVNITRQQMAAIMYRYANYKKMDNVDAAILGNISAFKDAAAVSDYATTPIKWVLGAGLMGNKKADEISPAKDVTRAEAAAMFRAVTK